MSGTYLNRTNQLKQTLLLRHWIQYYRSFYTTTVTTNILSIYRRSSIWIILFIIKDEWPGHLHSLNYFLRFALHVQASKQLIPDHIITIMTASFPYAALVSASAVITVGALLLSTSAYFFYDYTLKECIDSYLTSMFRQSVYEADENGGREVYKSDKPGFGGMMDEMKDMYEAHKGDQAYLEVGFAEGMDLFFTKLGINPDQYAAFCQKFPKIFAWFSKVSANITFSWVVGGAKICNVRGKTLMIEKCHFREAIGEGGCINLCKRPVEKYFTERMNSPIHINPQPKAQGLGCKFCYGECLPKELDWWMWGDARHGCIPKHCTELSVISQWRRVFFDVGIHSTYMIVIFESLWVHGVEFEIEKKNGIICSSSLSESFCDHITAIWNYIQRSTLNRSFVGGMYVPLEHWLNLWGPWRRVWNVTYN